MKDIENQVLEEDEGFIEDGVIQKGRFRKNDDKLFHVIFNLVPASRKKYCSNSGLNNDKDFDYWCNLYSLKNIFIYLIYYIMICFRNIKIIF